MGISNVVENLEAQRGRSVGIAPLALGVVEAAEAIGVGRSTMIRLVDAGKIRSVKIGRRRLIPVEELNRYLAVNLADGGSRDLQ